MVEEVLRSIQWEMWANETAYFASLLMLIGGAIGVAGSLVDDLDYWLEIGVYAIILGFLILLIEYPRSKKKKGRSLERRYQQHISKATSWCGILNKYLVRCCLYFLFSIPAILILPTFLGGITVITSCGIYLKAHLSGESFVAIEKQNTEKTQILQGVTTTPSKPPPRLPPSK